MIKFLYQMPKRRMPKPKKKRMMGPRRKKGMKMSGKKSSGKKSGGKSGRCWAGYKPTPGKKPYSKGSCQKG